MIDHLAGKVDKITPTYTVIDCNGVGYLAHISLHTYTQLKDATSVKILTHLAIREDAHVLYGFADEHERELFRLLISVSGIGSATARMILSSLNPVEIERAIATADLLTLKKIKGIGAKSAERILVDLKDKVGKSGFTVIEGTHTLGGNQEALMALLALGFTKQAVEKVLLKVRQENGSDLKVEEIIKQALKYL
jgi:Holliday junction DNA helicase RuvA